MRNEHFDIPVTVASGRRGRRIVTDTVQAAELLLDRWPETERGPQYCAALRACMDVMEQRKAVASARKAFVAAAKAAHVFVREGR
jgi:hypothetical protein